MKKREKKRKETRKARLRRVAPKHRFHLGKTTRLSSFEKWLIMNVK